MIGVVTSAKTQKTITVEVQRTFKHPKYGKFLRRRKRYLAHDEAGAAHEGDTVEIGSTRPMSRHKRWRLLRVITRSQLGMITHSDPTAEAMASIAVPAAGKQGAEQGSEGDAQ